MDPITIVTALLPVAQDGIRAVINKFTKGAGAKPATTAEAIMLMKAETERLRAVSDMDRPTGQVSVWVNNVRSMMRPAATVLILLAYFYTLVFDTEASIAMNATNLAASVVFYLFGDRTVMYMRGSDNA